MPHQCTNCGRTFADGSKEMLSGCPDCDGTTFQFSPGGFDSRGGETRRNPPDSPAPPDSPGDGMGRTVGSAAATVRDLVTGSVGPNATRAGPPDSDSGTAPDGSGPADPSDDDIIVAESAPPEDEAQAQARSDVANGDDHPHPAGVDPGAGEDSDGTAQSAAEDATAPPERRVATDPDAETADRSDLSQLREELNEQFESIRIVERGQYELNLMELYDRDEVVVALGEDGRYSIRVPEAIGEPGV